MTFPIAASELVPHSSRMLMIDSVVSADETSLTALALVREDHPLAENKEIGSWIGIEFMAQAVAAFEGCRARERGDKPQIGFLIGSRNYTSSVPAFPVGTSLQVFIERQYEEGGLGLFAGRITGDGFSAEGTVSVYQPENAEQFLKENWA